MSIKQLLIGGKTKLDITLERLRTYCDGKKICCSFSGGKDSQVCYHLLKDAGIQFDSILSITRFEPPEILRFVRDNYPDVQIRRAYKKTLVDDIKCHGLPTRYRRWCCEAKHAKIKGYDLLVVGVRAEESPRRREQWHLVGRKPDGSYYLCPVIDWTSGEVWEYLNGKGIPHCSLYDEGLERIGCVCCPLAVRYMRKQAARWPKTAAMLCNAWQAYYAMLQARDFKNTNGTTSMLIRLKNWQEGWERWLDTGYCVPPDTRDDCQECLFDGSGVGLGDGGNEA